MRLNLGCGFNHLDGFVNVDKEPACAPDRIVDLEEFPWPFAESSVDEVVASHILEHLGADTETYLAIIKELYRICVPGALIRIAVPHPRSDDFLIDPTHVRPILPDQMHLFSKAKNREWAEQGFANTPLALYLDVDFELDSVEWMPTELWRERLQAGEISADDLAEKALHQYNILQEIQMVLRVIKDGAEE